MNINRKMLDQINSVRDFYKSFKNNIIMVE